MSQTGPGRAHRKGITLLELMDLFPDDDSAERWFASIFWPDGGRCPACGSGNPDPAHAQAPALPLPPVPQGLLDQDRHLDAWLQARLPHLGRGHLLAHDQSQGRLEHETASRPRHPPSLRLQSFPKVFAPKTPDLGRFCLFFHGPCCKDFRKTL